MTPFTRYSLHEYFFRHLDISNFRWKIKRINENLHQSIANKRIVKPNEVDIPEDHNNSHNNDDDMKTTMIISKNTILRVRSIPNYDCIWWIWAYEDWGVSKIIFYLELIPTFERYIKRKKFLCFISKTIVFSHICVLNNKIL